MPNLIPALLIGIIWCGSFMIAASPFIFLGDAGNLAKLLSVAAAPLLFLISFPTLAGILSLPAQKGIVKGVFPREALHPIYLLRRIYGTCWTQVFYFRPVYAVILAVPLLKKYVLRLFGYRAATDFTVYPDTWIRDLPVLRIASGAYLSNRATIATNICLSDGNIMVDSIKVDEKGLVGHLAKIAPGTRIGAGVEIGVGTAVGIRVTLKEKADVKPSADVNHGAIIGKGAEVGTRSFVGLRAEVGDGVKLPPGSNIPAGAIIMTQQDADKYYSAETVKLIEHKESIAQMASKHLAHGS